MSTAKQLVFNSSIVLRIIRYLDWNDTAYLALYLKQCGLLRYEQEIEQLIKDKQWKDAEEYYAIRKTITNKDVGCATS